MTKQIKQILILIFTAILCFLYITPLIFMFFTSLKSLPEIMSGTFSILPDKWLFSNYIEAMQKGEWSRYFYNSFVITIVTVLISLIINSMAGYAFARIKFKGRDVLFFIALTGMMVPPQVTMIPVFINLSNFPLIGGNDIMGNGGVGLINTYAGLILPYIAGAFGVFLCRQFYINFPKSLDDAAEIDGCSKLTSYIKIYLPLSKPILATLAVLKTSQTWNDYMWPLIMTNTNKMQTVQIAVISKFSSEINVQWNLMMAATVVIILPLLILFLFTQKYFVEGIVNTGIKG